MGSEDAEPDRLGEPTCLHNNGEDCCLIPGDPEQQCSGPEWCCNYAPLTQDHMDILRAEIAALKAKLAGKDPSKVAEALEAARGLIRALDDRPYAIDMTNPAAERLGTALAALDKAQRVDNVE